ncbi:MAG: S9 family peptidase [Myxococcales bacterium]|nr:S9 family peptidase [Myxococcales bacterium]
MRRLVSIAICSLLWGCATPTANAAAAQTQAPAATPSKPRTDALDVETVVDLQYVSDVALSPNGKTVAYALRVPPDALDGPAGMRSVIWVVPTRGGRARSYTTPGASSHAPAWSPDGKRIAFLSRRPGTTHTQVYAVPIDGGEAEPITDPELSVRAFAWSPSGKQLAFLADRRPTKEEREAAAEGRDWQVGDVQGTSRRLWVMDLRTREAKPIGPRDTHVEQLAWAPDGKRLVVQASERADVDAVMMHSGLFTIAAEGGELTRLCPTEGKLGHVEWSPDGDRIAFLGASDIHDPTAGVLHVVPAEGGEATPLTLAYEGTGEWFHWVGKGSLLMLADQGTKTALHRVAVDGTMSGATVTTPVCHVADASDDGRTVACAGDRPDHPPEVFAGPPSGLRRLTHSNPELETKRLGERRVVRWKAADGLEIEGVLTLPVGYESGQRYPLAVLVHGGPEGISHDGWNTRGGYPTQLFATRGYVVLEPNYRGSRGRGVAFGKADHGDLGGKEFEDVLAGIDHLVAEGLVDGERVGMGGWSYGGYFSGLAATKHSKRFRAAMVGAAIIDWISFTGTSEIEQENSLVHWNLWPYEHASLAWERSPMAHTQGSTTATLVVHGMDDTRVPPGQGKELYRALRHAGTEAELVLYPREGHGLRERAHQIDFVGRWLDWFDEHVKGRATATAER